jgi:hypothetical protein
MSPYLDLSKLYEVAEDYEAAVLDRLRDRAGLTWECLNTDGHAHWTNDADERVCGKCGKVKP